MQGEARGNRVDAFDGLRALAVLAVLCFHSQFSWARGGFLGVSLFFTLSGYLITGLLLDEHERTGRVSLRSFWTRRARRLLPAAWIALAGAIVFGLTVASTDQLRSLRGDVLAALGDAANWRYYLSGQSYEHLFTAPSPVLHFWSLAIEEQFYILFPLLLVGILAVARGRRPVVAGVLGAGLAASVAAGVVLVGSAGQSRVYYGTDTRAAELLVGALLALVLRRAPSPRAASRAVAGGVGIAALGGLTYWWATVDQTAPWLYRGGFALHAVVAAGLIAAVRIDTPLTRALSCRPFVVVGLLSYGIYLFHWPVFLWLTPERTGLAAAPLFAVRFIVTGGLAFASYHLVEQPVRYGRRLPGRRPRVVAPAVAAALVVALVLATWTPPQREIVLSALGSGTASALDVRRVATMAPGAARPRPSRIHAPRVLVVGDSVGLTLGRGIELWARHQPGARVLNDARIYCPLGRTLEMRIASADHDPSACDWTARWRSDVEWFRPDVTIVLFTIWEAVPRRLPGAGWQVPGQVAYDTWQRREYRAAAATLEAGGGRIVWLTIPCEHGITNTPNGPRGHVNAATIRAMAAPPARVRVVDLDAELCPGGKQLRDYHGVVNFRPDQNHFSDAGALAVANWLMPTALA